MSANEVERYFIADSEKSHLSKAERKQLKQDIINDNTVNGIGGFGKKNVIMKYKKTGTTIAGCVVRVPIADGTGSGGKTTTTTTSKVLEYVVLAADTRATSGTMVADKSCSKIHPLASNCWCCGAGTSGDLDKVTRQLLFSSSYIQYIVSFHLHEECKGIGIIFFLSTLDLDGQ